MTATTRPSIGLVLPTMGTGASVEAIDAAADAATRVGWTDVWVPDHVLVDRASADQHGTILDPIVSLAHVATRHPGLRVGTAIILVPMRNAVILAKQLATLDLISGGRLQVGVGSGWSAAEYANVAPPGRFHERGAYLDEAISLWKHLWSGNTDPFHGRFHQLDDYAFEPLPDRGAGIPIWVGGRSPAAVRRAARLGDGHLASLTTPAELAERRDVLAREAEAAGRPMPRMATRLALGASDREDPGAAVELISAYGLAGAEQVVVSFGTTDSDAVVAAVERLAAAL